VSNSNLLDGLDSTAFMQGRTFDAAISPAHQPTVYRPIAAGAFGTVYLQCPAAGNNGIVYVRVSAGQTADIFFDNGGSNPVYESVTGPADSTTRGWAASGEAFTYGINGNESGAKLFSIHVFAVNLASDCRVQVHGTEAGFFSTY
jgi:hypothetical protein